MAKQPIDTSELMPKERRVLAVLHTPCTRAETARLTGLPRSTAEYTLRKLVAKKLARTERVGKRIKYFAPPFVAEEQTAAPSPIATIGPLTLYSGVRSMEKLWCEIADQPKGIRLIGVQPRNSFRQAITKSSKHIVHDVSKQLTDKRFIFDAIQHEDSARIIFERFGAEGARIGKVFTGRPEDMVKVDPPFLDENAEMFITPDYVVFMDWFSEIAVKIKDKNIRNFLVAIYEATKAYGIRYNQGEFIEQLISARRPK
jgi:hypothetical protein